MSGFSSDWLRLREPADRRARAGVLATRLAAWLTPRATARILDLGCGTGANLRWLAPLLPIAQRWHLIDNDPALLEALGPTLASWAQAGGRPIHPTRGGLTLDDTVDLSWERLDLSTASMPIAGRDLVTASALADLVSRRWLATLASDSARAGAAVLLALNYDGRIAFYPRDPADALIRDAVNRHQRGDKGFGPALGPDAVAAARSLLVAQGFQVMQARSDWQLDARDAAMQEALVTDWSRAATEVAGGNGASIAAWRARRLACIARDDSRMTVGHADLLALPALAP